jgi:hypothetical protein
MCSGPTTPLFSMSMFRRAYGAVSDTGSLLVSCDEHSIVLASEDLVSIVYDIQCDGCGVIIEADSRGAGYARARLKKEHGWHHFGRVDYCDPCWHTRD